jgi:hypothetical protein
LRSKGQGKKRCSYGERCIGVYTSGYQCQSWHGALNPGDSYVPLIVAYPGGTKSTIETVLKRDGVCKGPEGDYSNCKAIGVCLISSKDSLQSSTNRKNSHVRRIK